MELSHHQPSETAEEVMKEAQERKMEARIELMCTTPALRTAADALRATGTPSAEIVCALRRKAREKDAWTACRAVWRTDNSFSNATFRSQTVPTVLLTQQVILITITVDEDDLLEGDRNAKRVKR
jgi:hypothetical protein